MPLELRPWPIFAAILPSRPDNESLKPKAALLCRVKPDNLRGHVIKVYANKECPITHRIACHFPHQSDEITRGQTPIPVFGSIRGESSRHSWVVAESDCNSASRPNAHDLQILNKKASWF